jgi:hypothetical protein
VHISVLSYESLDPLLGGPDDKHLKLVEVILDGITGRSYSETTWLRQQWVRKNLPRTANLLGI